MAHYIYHTIHPTSPLYRSLYYIHRSRLDIHSHNSTLTTSYNSRHHATSTLRITQLNRALPNHSSPPTHTLYPLALYPTDPTPTMSVASAPRLSPPTHQYRHHPYAAPAQSSSSSSRPKWTASASANTEREKLQPPQQPRDVLPPSPPRSRRDQSETPSVGLPLGMAFGANGGGKWWDEELVSHPLTSEQGLIVC